jgi:hypothetical protein
MRRIATLLTTFALSMSGLVFSSAHANGVPSNGTYVCTTGVITTETTNIYTITGGVVSGGGSCAGAVVIPAGVTGIGSQAFQNASSMISILIPESLTSIGYDNLPRGLTSIIVNANNLTFTSPTSGVDAGVLFDKASTAILGYPPAKAGTSYSIPAGVTSIGAEAFKNSTLLTSISIPSSVTSIAASAFRYSGLTSITVDSANANYTSSSGVLFNKASTTIIHYPNEKSDTSYSIPSAVTSIGSYAFEITNLTSITIPSTVTSIGSMAFENADCTSIILQANITSIEQYTFLGAKFTSITIPSTVTSIGNYAFAYSNNRITSVYFLGNAPATVGTDAFLDVASGAKAYIKPGATGFTTSGTPALWNGLAVEVVADAQVPIIANAYRADSLGTVYFTPLSSKLSKAAKKQIDTLVAANPASIYKVTGHVQKSIFAKNAKNDASLSLARAKAIETYLVSLGAGVNFTVVVDAGLVPAKNGASSKARRATLYAMTPVVQ